MNGVRRVGVSGEGVSTVTQFGTRAQFLTVAQAAAVLRVSTTTVYRLMSSGDLAAVRVGSSHRIREDDVDRYLAARCARAG